MRKIPGGWGQRPQISQVDLTCLLKEEFQFFWDYVYPRAATNFLEQWCRKVMKSRLKPVKKIAQMLQRVSENHTASAPPMP